MLAQPTDLDRDFYYLALVDYADGLARFSDDRAWGYFEEAIDFHPENNLEAINRYTQHLLSRRREQVQQALEVLDTRLTSEQRVRFVLPARLRKQAMEILGLDTTSADAEVATIEQRLSGGWGKAPTEERSSKVTGTEAPVVASFTLDSRIPTIFAPAVALAVTSDSRVSAIFAVLPDNTDTQKVDERTIQQDAIFNPNGAMNNRWTSLSPTTTAVKLATLKWPNSNRAGLVRLGTDNTVYYRYFNGASWGTWQSLGQTALDVAATAWPPGPADIYIVGLDGYIRQSHSPNGQPGSWGTWVSHACCASEVATAVTPGGLLYLAAQATTQSLGYAVWVTTTSNSSTYTPWINLGQAPGGQVKDLTLLAYNNVVGLAVVGANNCSLYQKHNNGGVWYASWFNYSSSPCFKNVSSFNTDDGGAYLVYIGTSTNALSTQRFTGGAWAGIVPQGTRTWIAAAGANIDDEAGNAYEHTEANDDCRVKHYSSGPVCDNYGNCFWTQGVNLAEIIYNEARAETLGAQDAVGWTVRDRAFEGLSNPSLCNSYPGAEAGGTLTADCRNPDTGVPCNQNGFCDNTPRYCCAMHGGQTQLGTSGYQFIDEHVDINTLVSSGVMDEAVWVGNGLVPDMSTGWCPPGVGNCYLNCAAPWSDGINFNFSDPSPHGPMEFRGFAYPVPNSSCQQAPTTNTCPGGAANSICCNASPNNYFWNRK